MKHWRQYETFLFALDGKLTMPNVLEVEQVNAVEAVESTVFEIRLLLQLGNA